MSLKPICKFSISTGKGNQNVRVIIWDSLHDLRKRRKELGPVGAIYAFFNSNEVLNKSGRRNQCIGEVHLARHHLGIGILSHEFAHAALWTMQVNGKRISNMLWPASPEEEYLAWLVGEMTRICVLKLYELNLYKGNRDESKIT